ncbi:EAL domain-containing protein [Enterobacter ludwigii]|uniref:EAL domain-containing protein n=1 Tax=Enterobacter ludwigii TaxID=299767 RepID=UPI003976FD42
MVVDQCFKKKQISVSYQPIVNVKTGELYGLEALSRGFIDSKHDTHPADFVAQFENGGMAREFTLHLLNTIDHDIENVVGLVKENIKLSINFNALSIQQPQFIDDCMLFNRKMMAKKITFCVEVTEVQNLNSLALSTLQTLKMCNVGIFLDDFGTKYSNLSYLLDLDVDALKVDRAFVKKIHSPMGKDILKMIIDFSNHAGLDVISEGVESESQSKLLVALGSYLQQGYVHSWPMDIDRLKEYLKAIKVANNK